MTEISTQPVVASARIDPLRLEDGSSSWRGQIFDKEFRRRNLFGVDWYRRREDVEVLDFAWKRRHEIHFRRGNDLGYRGKANLGVGFGNGLVGPISGELQFWFYVVANSETVKSPIT